MPVIEATKFILAVGFPKFVTPNEFLSSKILKTVRVRADKF